MKPTKHAAMIATWNLEWAKPGSASLNIMLSRLSTHMPDVICFTEGYPEGVPTGGYTITGAEDWGYPTDPDRRKVMLWSKSPWQDVDQTGDIELPGGRFIAGSTETPLGMLRVIGVCIPWRDAHVRTGRKDRQAWEDHLAYLEALGRIVNDRAARTILLGDFNQRVPRRWTPEHIHQQLLDTLEDKFAIATGGRLEPIGAQAIDHIALTSDLEADKVATVSNLGNDGRELSDHFGVTAEVTLAS